ncbi:MAG: hypothetical protein U0175_07015 [Caldilineaceae bacterium]
MLAIDRRPACIAGAQCSISWVAQLQAKVSPPQPVAAEAEQDRGRWRG